MAARGGGFILLSIILSIAILPLLASSAFFFPDIPGLFFPRRHAPDFNDYNSPPANDESGDGGEGNDEPESGDGLVPGVESAPFFPWPWGGGGREPAAAEEGIREGFYGDSCPQAEKIVNEVIQKHFDKDPTIAPALVRLFFHDCFVKGCDASILLEETPEGEPVEKNATHNGPFVRGYDVIDDIKVHLEDACPGVVSCADILAFANRESLIYTGVPTYNVAAGRRDGLSSLASSVPDNIPLPASPAEAIIQMFQNKNMSLEDLVVLIGAHSIGNAHCDIVAKRFHDPARTKDMDPGYVLTMQVMTFCQTDTQDLPFDQSSSQKMDSTFYKQLLERKALLESDENITKEPAANAIMKKLVDDQNGWLEKFTKAIIKLGQIEVLTGNQGEIRKNCRAVN